MITPFNIFARGGGGLLISYEYKTYKLMVYPIPHELILVVMMMIVIIIIVIIIITIMIMIIMMLRL